jgi:hypothetical protein
MHSLSLSKNILSVILFLMIAGLIGCAGATKRDFVDACYNENRGLPMSQMEMLYTGYKDHDDTGAYGTLRENCPKAVKKYMK